MDGNWRRALSPLGPVGAQALSQGANLLTQLALVALLGQERFADLGLGLMAATSVCFLGEVGFGPFFLRHAAMSPDWLTSWRQAAGSRLVVSAAALALAWLALAWGAPHPESARLVLLAAVPGIVASAVVPAPLLFGMGRVRMASASVLGRFATQSAASLTAALAAPDHMEAWLGLAFSGGILVQVLAGQLAGLPLAALLPARPRSLPPRPALRLWGLSLVGTLNDRALPFLIGASRPEILAVALIAIQALQSLAGLGGQIDRLLIPQVARQDGARPDFAALWKALRLFITFVAISFIAPAAALTQNQLWVAFLLVLEWSMVLIGALTFAVTFARGSERRVARFMLVALPLSAALQVAAINHVPLEAVLGLRVCVAALAAWLAAQGMTAPAGVRHEA